MVIIKWHLINVPKDAPVHEVTDQTGQTSYSFTFDLIKCHINMLRSNLTICEMHCLVYFTCCTRLMNGFWTLELKSILWTIQFTFITKYTAFWWWYDFIHGILHCLFLSVQLLLKLLIRLVWNDLDRKIFDELGKISSNVIHRYI